MDPGVLRNLRPVALVARAQRCSLEQWLREVEVPLLLVKVDDLEGETAKALEGPGGDRVRGEVGMGFHTASVQAVTTRPKTIPPRSTPAPEQLLVRFLRAPHVIVPVGKRAEAGRVFAERVTVGRARNSDIVIRDESVSKFHAWFARDEGNAYYVADASSRNGTWRDGVAIEGGVPVRLSNGDVLRFGNVEAIYCDPATLHRALHA